MSEDKQKITVSTQTIYKPINQTSTCNGITTEEN